MDNFQRSTVSAGLLVVLVVLFGGYLLSWFTRDHPSSSREMTQSEEPTPTLDDLQYADPMMSAEIAISQSLASFPDGFNPVSTTAKLLKVETLDRWRGTSSPMIEPHVPAWLVAITASNLKVSDVLDFYSEEQGNMDAEGVYYAWDANSGYMIGTGMLGAQWRQTFASVEALEDEPLTISPATLVPPPPTETPDASSTP